MTWTPPFRGNLSRMHCILYQSAHNIRSA